MLGAWQDLRQVTAGSGAGGARLWEPARRGVGSCATSQTRGGFPACSHSLLSAPSTSTSGLRLAKPEGQASQESHCAGASFLLADQQAPPLFFFQFSCCGIPNCRAYAFCAVLALRLLFLHGSPLPPLLSLTAYFAAAPRAPPPFSAESPWRLG